jgi:uncharacterized protein (TIGR03089 family)
VELSGATCANWAAKTANLLVDGLGRPDRVGLLLPLHWQAVTLLLGIVATGATAVVARTPADLAGCGAAFADPDLAEAAQAAGVDDVYAVSTAPLGGRLRAPLPPMVLDAGAEIPVHGDYFGGRPAGWSVVLDGQPVEDVPSLGLGGSDRVLTVLAPADGLLLGLLAPLRAGAGLVLCPGPVPSAHVLAAEGVTASVGVDLPGLRRLDRP